MLRTCIRLLEVVTEPSEGYESPWNMGAECQGTYGDQMTKIFGREMNLVLNILMMEWQRNLAGQQQKRLHWDLGVARTKNETW